MRKINNLINITVMVIINTLLICPALFAQDIIIETNQSRHMLSPIAQISNQVIQQSFTLNNINLPLITPRDLEAYSLEQLSKQIIVQCQSNNFSLLKVNWEKKHLDYQQFIKEAAAINSAINHFISLETIPKSMNYFLFLEKAIQTRMKIIEKYQAPLSPLGIKKISSLKQQKTDLTTLILLMNPPKEWFKPLFDNKRKEALLRNYEPPAIIATWGCSTQCDHCDGAAVIEIESFPWVWIKEAIEINLQLITPMEIAPYHNDHFRDYYDLVYDKDASDLYSPLDRERTSTSGFAPGSVGERAIKRVLSPELRQVFIERGGFQISIAPSAWMRSVIQKHGTKGFMNYLENIEDMFYDAGVIKFLHQYSIFNFQRVDDPPEHIKEILKFCQDSNIAAIRNAIHISGRYHQLESAGEIYPMNINNPLYRLPRNLDKTVEKAHFIFDDLEQYFILPDGQVILGIQPNISILLRRYTTISGLESIGRREIKCLACKSPSCPGKQNENCIGRNKVFIHMGLSPSGGFNSSYLNLYSSI